MSDRILSNNGRFEVVVQPDGHVNRWDYVLERWDTILPSGEPLPPPPPPPPVRPAEPLHVRASAFRRPDGTIWKYRGFTAFTALEDFIEGKTDKLQRYVDYTLSKGGTVWRIFMIWRNLPLDPRGRGADYYRAIARLTRWLNERGTVPHWVLFCDQTDGSPVLLTADEQEAHFTAAVGTLIDNGVSLVEEVNERFKNANWDADRWGPERFTGVIGARSSWQDDEFPPAVGTILDWSTVHTPRDGQWPRKSKALVDVTRLGAEKRDNDGNVIDSFEPTFKPCIAGEPEKIDGQSPTDYAAYLALAEMWGGGLIHGGFKTLTGVGTDLQNCIAPDDGTNEARVIDAVAEVWAAGIPAEAAGEFSYTRGPFDSCALVHRDDWALRTFGMIGGNRQVVVVVRPNGQWRQITQGGWQVERRVGPVFFCRR